MKVFKKIFRLSLTQGFLRYVSEMHGIFFNSDLPFISMGEGERSAIAISDNVWGGSWKTMTKTLEKFFLPNVLF